MAEAAVFFINRKISHPKIFFVSLDDEPKNTVFSLWSIYRAVSLKSTKYFFSFRFCLPLFIPHIHRKIMRRVGNRGDVRFTSKRILDEGFHFKFSVSGAVKKIYKDRKFRSLC